jgi:hypothetical protein
MFTDSPAVPARVEALIGSMRLFPDGLSRSKIYRLLQPESLSEKSELAKATVKACYELNILLEDSGKLKLAGNYLKVDDKEAILSTFDDKILCDQEVEKYFALFFSYHLGLNKRVYEFSNNNNQQWADIFNKQVYDGKLPSNPLNQTKVTGLYRWYDYVGLGWFDPYENFTANPYERLKRSLNKIFGKSKKLDADSFMGKLCEVCPELDGGKLFLKANPKWEEAGKNCSLGLSHALIELHMDSIIRLECPADASGWSLAEAKPPSDEDFVSDKFATINKL